MNAAFFHLAESRGILALAGEDRQAFLQGLVSNDLRYVSPERAIHAAFLTAQGKYLHDFFIAEIGDSYLLDVEGERRGDLLKRLSLYKLRSRIRLEDAQASFAVALLYGEKALAQAGLPARRGAARVQDGGLLYVDPRLAEIGARAILPRDKAAAILAGLGFAPGNFADYDRRRIALGLADGSRDLVLEKSILLENGFDEGGSIDWQKGCYLGQELTARTKYRGLVKKRLLPVAIEGAPPPPATPLYCAGIEAGEMRGAHADGKSGLALIRLERLPEILAKGLESGSTRLSPRLPDWIVLPQTATDEVRS